MVNVSATSATFRWNVSPIKLIQQACLHAIICLLYEHNGMHLFYYHFMQAYSFPSNINSSYRSYQLHFKIIGSWTAILSSSQTVYTVGLLTFNEQYNVTVRATMRQSRYYCYTYLHGEFSNTITITTVETGNSV